jgi:hypothetical protein
MFLASINKSKQLLYLSFIQQVRAEELERSREDVVTLLADLTAGFRLLTDFGRLDSLAADCATEIGRMMDLFDQKGVGFVVRVIPDPTKDFGMNILSLFHYRSRPRILTCNSMMEAAELLAL